MNRLLRLLLGALVVLTAACGRSRNPPPARSGPAAAPAVPALPPAPRPVFESGLWPGEGIPVVQATRGRIQLRGVPRLDARVRDTLVVTSGSALAYDSTRYQTISPAPVVVLRTSEVRGRFLGSRRLLSLQDYYSDAFRDTAISVGPPDTVQYLQYRAEGTCFVSVRGNVLDADPCPIQGDPAFRLAGQPVTHWWIHVRMSKGAGWLFLADSVAKVVNRTF